MGKNRAPDSERLGGTIDALYAASLDETLWQGTLAEISSMFGGVGTLLVRGRRNRDLELTWIQEHVPAVEGRWDHYMAYRDLDIRTAYALRKPAPMVYVDQEFIDDRAIDRHPFYQEFMAIHEIRYTVGGRFLAEDDEFGIINVFRNKAQGHHERPAVELMQALVPHLTRACAIDQRLAAARRSERHLRDALDRVPDAIFLLDPDGRIIDANRSAERLLRARDGLAAPQSRLTAVHAATRRSLAGAIAAAAERRVHPSTARALPIPRPSGGRPLQALVMPMPRAERLFPVMAARPPMVMVVVGDPDALPMPLPERLAVLWDLTPAESRLGAALAGGQAVQDYADRHGLTENTVRWTLKRLLAKTDCRRQPEMVRLLATAATFW